MFAALFCLNAAIQQEPDLLQKSTLVASLPSRQLPGYAYSITAYAWVNSNQLICSLPESDDLYLLDVRSHKSRKLKGLTRIAGKQRLVGMPIPDPQGRLLLWQADTSEGKPLWTVTTVNGRLVGKWRKSERLSTVAWSQDGNALLEWEGSKFNDPTLRLWRRPVSNLAHKTRVPLPKEPDPAATLTNVAQLPDGTFAAIFYTLYASPPGFDNQTSLWSSGNPVKARTFSVGIPSSNGASLCDFSPDGKSIVWQSTEWQESTTLWTSNLDGTNVRELGIVKFDKKIQDSDGLHFGEVKCIPGAHAVSFVYKDKLYEVSAD